MAPILQPSGPRCTSCDQVLVHAGAICVVCDDAVLYEAPIRNSPPLRFARPEDSAIANDQGEANASG